MIVNLFDLDLHSIDLVGIKVAGHIERLQVSVSTRRFHRHEKFLLPLQSGMRAAEGHHRYSPDFWSGLAAADDLKSIRTPFLLWA